MEISSILILGIITLISISFLIRPLIKPMNHSADRKDASKNLLARKDHLVTEMEGLEFDYKMGRVTEQDYRHQYNELIQLGGEIMQGLEATNKIHEDINSTSGMGPGFLTDEDVEKLIEKRKTQKKY